uniref:Uncharacterized protein n=2 Tax=Klebsiella/Raoultella group TaxID=2890311 RepID=A0A6G6AP28_KLEPN|nr:hypothetical protein [Klebsiella pneumoniae]QNL32399.1 Hypothetical protein [Raoultella ornithinolytica]UFD96462.1 hypothetical protein [Klebsiella oxytoca]UFD97184.1 hypothetical protein [Klebsiella pneumoniae]
MLLSWHNGTVKFHTLAVLKSYFLTIFCLTFINFFANELTVL